MNTTGIIGHTRQLEVLSLLFWHKTVPHTMLFTGMAGIGKKLVARRFLTALFCAGEKPPCLKCPACLQAASRTLPDFIELSPDDKGNIPIGDADRGEQGSVRWLIDRLSRKSVSGKFGVLIDGVESISIPGQNALLKTIEEPQEGAHIIIITSQKSQVLPTIQSRCMELPFNPLSNEEVKQVLAHQSGQSDTELVSALSGGSAEIALILANTDTRDLIYGICGEIGRNLSKGERLKLDIAPIQKKVSMDNLLSILINVYRALLSSSIFGASLSGFPAGVEIEDRQKLMKLIKILLALKKGLANNLNIRSALKGMLYSIDNFDGLGLPKLDQMQ